MVVVRTRLLLRPMSGSLLPPVALRKAGPVSCLGSIVELNLWVEERVSQL